MKKFTAKCRLHTLEEADPAFETIDAALFETHMRTLHDKTPARGYGDSVESKALHRLWKAPRIPENGKPFEPTGLELGADITWRELVGTGVFRTERRFDHATKCDVPYEVEEREWVERRGQVWSLGSLPKSAWVIPYDEVDEGELAVLVREDRLTHGFRHSATWTAVGYRDAA